MPERGVVTLSNGARAKIAFGLETLANMIYRLREPNFREVFGGVVQPLRLDPASRRADGNPVRQEKAKNDEGDDAADASVGSGAGTGEGGADSDDGKAKPRGKIRSDRRFTKGVSMEVVVAGALTWVDHPDEVKGNWALGPNNRPKSHAQAGDPDIFIPATRGVPRFQIVCEVSSFHSVDESYLHRQLRSTLAHCTKATQGEGDGVEGCLTYGLLVNSGAIGENKKLHGAYRSFIAANEVLENPEGLIRIVSLHMRDFSFLLKEMYNKYQLDFSKPVFALALDALHVQLREEKLPTGARWMPKLFMETVAKETEKEASRQMDLFAPPAGGGGAGDTARQRGAGGTA